MASLATLVGPGCGLTEDDPELSRTAARALRAELNQVESSVRAGNCTEAQAAVARLEEEVDGLRGDVSADLRSALAGSAERLATLVRDQCEPAQAAPVVTPEPAQDTSQQERGKEEKQDKQNKPGKDPQNKEKPKEVPPGQDDGDGTTPPGQQDGDDGFPGGDTGGATPQGG